MAHLPKAERPLIQHEIRDAWGNLDADTARGELPRSRERWTRSARALPPRCGKVEDSLTVNRLGVTGSLLKTVESSTNPAESMIEIVRHDHSR